jgi:DNA-binding Lrp family transcriptional regulator
MTTILTQVDGWTPLIDDLTKELGLVTSAVFGRVWRFCQGEKRVCVASLETIAEDLHLDKGTVQRHIKKLCSQKYLKDITPGLRNVPHTYADTGKISIYTKVSVAHNNSYESVAQNNSLCESVADNNATVADDQLKIVFKKDNTKKDIAPNGARAKNGKKEIPEKPEVVETNPVLLKYPILKRYKKANGDLLFAFWEATGIKPIDRDYQFNYRTTNGMVARGITPEIIKKAIYKMRNDGLVISGPQSVEKVAISILAESESNGRKKELYSQNVPEQYVEMIPGETMAEHIARNRAARAEKEIA